MNMVKHVAFIFLALVLCMQSPMFAGVVTNESTHVTYTTIQSAVSAALTNETLSASGIFYEHNIIWPNIMHITLCGSGSDETIIDAGSLGSIITLDAGADLTLESLTLRNGLVSGNGSLAAWDGSF